MAFVAAELPTFSIKTSKYLIKKNYLISITSGRVPLKIFPWPTGWEILVKS